MIKAKGIKPLMGHVSNLKWLIPRGVFGATAMTTFYAAILLLPLADGMTLFFLNPCLTGVTGRAHTRVHHVRPVCCVYSETATTRHVATSLFEAAHWHSSTCTGALLVVLSSQPPVFSTYGMLKTPAWSLFTPLLLPCPDCSCGRLGAEVRAAPRGCEMVAVAFLFWGS